MKAVVLTNQGPPDNLVFSDAPTPKPGPGEVLIRVTFAGANFGETMQRAGTYPLPIPLPVILGSEVYGKIEALGAGVDSWRVGDAVCALLNKSDGSFSSGGYAEFAVAPIERVYPVREDVDGPTSLALLSQGLTALWLLEKAAGLQRGQTVLVHAAAGGVGSLAVQLARSFGAQKVVGAAGAAEKRTFVRSLGAETIDSTTDNWAAMAHAANGGRGFDIILDPLGGDATALNLSVLAPHGHVVVFGGMSGRMPQLKDEHWGGVIFQNQRVSGFANMAYLADAGETRSAIARLFDLAARGVLRAERTMFPLFEASHAHRAFEARSTIGKVVLQVTQ